MTTSTRRATRTATRTPTRSTLRFAGHFLEMVVAMLVGMAALGWLWSLALPGLTGLADARALVMATNMAVGMAVWMRIRRHSWPRIAEMAAAMYLPFLVLLVPYWLGAISGEVLITAGHVLMVPLMLVAMLWCRDDYSH